MAEKQILIRKLTKLFYFELKIYYLTASNLGAVFSLKSNFVIFINI